MNEKTRDHIWKMRKRMERINRALSECFEDSPALFGDMDSKTGPQTSQPETAAGRGGDESLDCTLIDLLLDAKDNSVVTDEYFRKLQRRVLPEEGSNFSSAWDKYDMNNMPEMEGRAFVTLLSHFAKCFSQPFQYSKTLDRKMEESDCSDQFGRKSGSGGTAAAFKSLVAKGLAERTDDGYRITPEVAMSFFKGEGSIVSYDRMGLYARVIKAERVEKKDLYYSEKSEDEINSLISLLSPEAFANACSILVKCGRKPAVQSLLWGPPGSGKTETALQISRRTGRDIIAFDFALVVASEWGAAEKMHRALFREYAYIAAVSSRVPILLLDEADLVLSKRMSRFDQAMEKSFNVLSNLVLEEMENMHGILIATTNCADLLDKAFDLRFLFKTELGYPDEAAREKIWESNLPGLKDYISSYLAQQYELTGAQISNIASRIILASLIPGNELNLEYLESLCQKEMDLEKLNGTRNNRSGFLSDANKSDRASCVGRCKGLGRSREI